VLFLGIISLILSAYFFKTHIFLDLKQKHESKNEKTNQNQKTDFIPVVVCFDSNYFYPSIVSVTSMLENSNKETCYEIFALISGDITENDRQKFKDLEKRYINSKIELIDMKNQFKKYSNNRDFCEGTFYRLKIPDLLPKEIHKCIYLDSDVLVVKDLRELIDHGIAKNRYICS
jgi:capsular polysaccharide export protein